MSEQVTLQTATSDGPRPDFYDDDGSLIRGSVSACPGCRQVPLRGMEITKLFGEWWHVECGTKHLSEVGANRAWIALGLQLERSPSRFTVADTRTIVRNLLRITGARLTLPLLDVEEIDPNDPDEMDPGETLVWSGLRSIRGGLSDEPDPWASAMPD
ncbi:hypothetical protein ABZW49_10445 [Nonomuraea wenchangensis]|uniref:hypothetical protein n=1 Tax=Nonomuraea bangladeshensis TaxID=404385 RepID=UPI003473CBA1